MPAWTERLIGWGYATLILDSFGARHVTSVCAPAYQPLVTNLDRAGDVMNAAAWLQGVPGIDGKRVGVVGFSHGGGTAVAVTRDEVQRSGRLERLEQIMSSDALLARANVVFTPHVAFNSVEAVERLACGTVENIRAFARGEPINLG